MNVLFNLQCNFEVFLNIIKYHYKGIFFHYSTEVNEF